MRAFTFNLSIYPVSNLHVMNDLSPFNDEQEGKFPRWPAASELLLAHCCFLNATAVSIQLQKCLLEKMFVSAMLIFGSGGSGGVIPPPPLR